MQSLIKNKLRASKQASDNIAHVVNVKYHKSFLVWRCDDDDRATNNIIHTFGGSPLGKVINH